MKFFIQRYNSTTFDQLTTHQANELINSSDIEQEFVNPIERKEYFSIGVNSTNESVEFFNTQTVRTVVHFDSEYDLYITD